MVAPVICKQAIVAHSLCMQYTLVCKHRHLQGLKMKCFMLVFLLIDSYNLVCKDL